jgi:hypothetical protein
MRPAFLVASLCIIVAPVVAQTGMLHYTVPDGWTKEQPRSSMRQAQFTLPRAAGDSDDGEAVIFFFGQGQGGSVTANLERWAGQVELAGGRRGTVKDGKTSTFTANGHNVTVLDIAGTYVAETMPGSGQRLNKPGFRMKAAVIETPGGPYFVKITGPAKTIARWDAAIEQFLKSMSFR